MQNNNLLVSGSQDGTAKLWNPNSGKCVGTLMAGKGQEGAFQFRAPTMANVVDRNRNLTLGTVTFFPL